MKKYNGLTFGLILAVCLLSVLATSPGTAQDESDNTYVVGPGDVLNIQVWDHNDLSRTVEISQDGIFTFPFIGQVDTSNLSIIQIERLLTRKLSDGYLVAPQVNITVTEYRNQTVFLLGQVARPGSYVLKHRNHLLELISKAGGFTEQRGTTCTIVRPGSGANKKEPTAIHAAQKSEIIQINLDELLSGAEGTPPFYVMPGDSIYISGSEKIFVTGEVRRPGIFRWEKGLTVRQAVSMAGGKTPRASISRIRIIRNDNGVEKMVKPKMGDTVLPNDIIKVPESYF